MSNEETDEELVNSMLIMHKEKRHDEVKQILKQCNRSTRHAFKDIVGRSHHHRKEGEPVAAEPESVASKGTAELLPPPAGPGGAELRSPRMQFAVIKEDIGVETKRRFLLPTVFRQQLAFVRLARMAREAVHAHRLLKAEKRNPSLLLTPQGLVGGSKKQPAAAAQAPTATGGDSTSTGGEPPSAKGTAGTDGGLEALRSMRDQNPDDPEAAYALGYSLVHVFQKPKEGLKHLQHALSLSPDDANYAGEVGLTLMTLGRLDEASAAFTKALELNPGSVPNLINAANCAVKKEDDSSAVTLYKRALEGNEDDCLALRNLGSVLHRMRRFAEAVDVFGRLLKLSAAAGTGTSDTNRKLGELHFELMQLDDSERHLNDAIASGFGVGSGATAQTEARTRETLAQVMERTGRPDDAIEQYHSVIGLEPQNATVKTALGALLLDQGDLDEACSILRSAIENNKNSASAHNHLGIALFRTGEVEDAKAAFESALELAERTDHATDADKRVAVKILSSAHGNLGHILDDLGQYADAIDNYQQALSHDPDNPTTLSKLATTYTHAGQIEDAIESFEQSLKFGPNHEVTIYNLAAAYGNQQNLPKAFEWCKKLLEINPDHAQGTQMHAMLLPHCA